MTNAHYNDISQYRDVESLNYYKILLDQGKPKSRLLRFWLPDQETTAEHRCSGLMTKTQDSQKEHRGSSSREL